MADIKFDFKKAMVLACDLAILALQDELDNQNHNATGALSNAIKSKISFFADGAKGEISTYLYGSAVNFGVPASRFKFGGKKHIKALVKWIGNKGITPTKGADELNVKKFAWAIVKKHKKEGIPTLNSYKFSRNGKRLGFMTDALTVAEKTIEATLPINVTLDVTFEL